MHRRKVVILITLLLSVVLCGFISGCDTLRLAPTESQKQIALRTHLNARAVDAGGAEADTPATQQLVQGTEVAVNYAGLPNNPDIADYDQTLQQAHADAAKRPTAEKIFEAVDEGLSLAAQLAILFGCGGTTWGGVKIAEWISRARKKSQGLQEIINANSDFLRTAGEDARSAFKAAQDNKQSTATKKIVAELKI